MIPSISNASPRRCSFSRYLISFLSFSLVGLCTSEALTSSSTSFLPRSLRTRGGSEAKAPLKCVLQVPRSSKSALGDSNNEDGGGKFGRVTKLNGSSLKNGQVKQQPTKRNGSTAEYADYPIPAEFVAETDLPTDVGHYRLRAYRTERGSNEFTGTEPCVIYAADKSPFGSNGELREHAPVRIHDQCLTSEVFRSRRYVTRGAFHVVD